MSTPSKTKSPKALSMMENFWDTDIFDNANEPLHAVNIRDRENKLKIEIAAPGFKKGNFKIAIDNGLLTIMAESSREDSILDEDYTRMEFSRSSFAGSFVLPKEVSADHISAKYRRGLLTINLKKLNKLKAEEKRVKVAK